MLLKSPTTRMLCMLPFAAPWIAPLVGLMVSTNTAAQSLDEVVVSASRIAQRTFDTPAAIQSVNRELIQGAGPQVNLSESLTRVPGLTVLDRQNYAQDLQVSIRGFGARSAFGIRGIRLLIDGIPATTPDGQGQGSSISLPSTDRIEVLRGPMALLYGNSSGGVIQAFTKAAPKDAELTYQYYTGSYGLRRADYQWGDTLGSVGIVADYSTFSTDGYRVNSAAQRKQFNAKLEFAPRDALRVNLVFNRFDMPEALDPLGLTRAQLTADPSQAGTNAVKYSVRKAVLQNQLGGSASYALDADQSITTRAYYGARDNLQYQAGTTVNGAWTGLNRNYYGAGVQYNARSEWGSVPVQWAAGYEFDRSREFRQAGPSLNGQKTGQPNRSEDNQSDNSDLFVQGQALVSERLSVATGLRNSHVRFASDDYYLADKNDGSGAVAYQSTTPVLGLTFHALPELNLYANYGRGFETPTLAEMAYKNGTGTNVVGQFNTALNASSSRHYELGSKWAPSKSSRLDFAVYQIDTVDELVVLRSVAGQTAYKNAPGTSRSGWELSGGLQFNPHLTFNASASIIDAHYAQAFTSGATAIDAGKQMPGIPQSFLYSELAWNQQPLSARGPQPGLRLAAELVQAGRIYANDTNTESADGRTVVNLSLSHRWSLANGGINAYARVNNVSDERYVGSVIVNQAAGQYFEPGLPRNWTVGLNLQFAL